MKLKQFATVALFLFVLAAVYYTAGPKVLGKVLPGHATSETQAVAPEIKSQPTNIALGTGLAPEVKPSSVPKPIAPASPAPAKPTHSPAPTEIPPIKEPTPASSVLAATPAPDPFSTTSLLSSNASTLLPSSSLLEANNPLSALSGKADQGKQEPTFAFDRPDISPEKLAKADQFVTPEIEAAAKRSQQVVTKQNLPFEDTNLTVTRGILFTGKDGVSKTIPVTIPVRFRSGSIYLDEARLNELYAIEAQMQQIIAAAEELRVAASMLTERQNELLNKSIPKESLKSNSFSVPGVGVGAQWARDAYRDVPQSEIKINQVK